MVDHERALGRPASRAALLNEITADPTWQPTFVFYMGYPKLSAHASPPPSCSSCTRLTAQIPRALLERGASRNGIAAVEDVTTDLYVNLGPMFLPSLLGTPHPMLVITNPGLHGVEAR